MKGLIFCFFAFLLFQLNESADFKNEIKEFQNDDNNLTIVYNAYDNGTKIATVKLNGACKYLYVWIDESQTECRVRTSPLNESARDHYATVTYTNIPNEERVVALPWTSNWIYAGIVPTTQYRSSNGLPREFSLFKVKGEYFLNVAPAREALKLRTTTTVPISVTVHKKKRAKTVLHYV